MILIFGIGDIFYTCLIIDEINQKIERSIVFMIIKYYNIIMSYLLRFNISCYCNKNYNNIIY